MNNIFLILLSLSMSGSILIMLLLALKPFIKKRFSNTWQYYIWFIILLRFLLPITAEVNFMGYIAQHIESNITATNQTSGQNVPKSEPGALIDGETWLQIPQTKDDAVTPAEQNVGKVIQDNVWMIWAAGMLMMFFYKIISYNAFVRFVKVRAELVTDPGVLDIYRTELASAKVKRKIPLKLNDRIGSPMLAGIIRPILVIPSLEVSSSNLQYIFRHELIHYKRGDILYKWLAQITKCVHWFNPFVYMVSKQIDQSCELSCDEVIIKHLDKTAKESYGDALIASLKSQENYSAFVISMTMSDNKKRLKERLDAIMNFKKTTRLAMVFSFTMVLALCFGATALGAYAIVPSANESIQSDQQTNDYIDKKEEASPNEEYAEWGVVKENGAYYYNDKRVRIFMDLRANNSFVNFKYDASGTIDLKLIRNQNGIITGAEYLTQAEAEEILKDLDVAQSNLTPSEDIRDDTKRLTKETVPEEVLSVINSCDEGIWYVITGTDHQYIYYNGVPHNYAWQPKVNKSSANISIFDIGKSTSTYVLLSVPNNLELTISYNSKNVSYTTVSATIDGE